MMTITIGWWLLPVAVTVGSFAWAIPMRQDERPTGQMFDGMGYALGKALRCSAAAIVSLVVWLMWALLA